MGKWDLRKKELKRRKELWRRLGDYFLTNEMSCEGTTTFLNEGYLPVAILFDKPLNAGNGQRTWGTVWASRWPVNTPGANTQKEFEKLCAWYTAHLTGVGYQVGLVGTAKGRFVVEASDKPEMVEEASVNLLRTKSEKK